ncbi:MAG: hypothetical protein RLZZ301_603 [Bacteroidota bacterium]|jgi:hypothetical protein
MKQLLILIFTPSIFFAQGGFKKSEKKGNDYLQVKNHGYQFSIGPTYSFVNKPLSGQLSDNLGVRGDWTITPAAQLGFYAEAGFAHFPKWKGTPIKALHKSRIMDYFDWGIGYRQLRGTESTAITYKNALGEVIGTSSGIGQLSTGYLYGSIRAHSLIYFGKKVVVKVRKHFLDQSLGMNLDFNLYTGPMSYKDNFISYQAPQVFQPNLSTWMLQFNYQLGIGIRLNKAWILIPGASIPIVTLSPWNGFNANLYWYSSNYWPIQAQFKVIKLIEVPPKCGVYSTPEDREMEKQYRLNN